LGSEKVPDGAGGGGGKFFRDSPPEQTSGYIATSGDIAKQVKYDIMYVQGE
jgi:hypothetical protein